MKLMPEVIDRQQQFNRHIQKQWRNVKKELPGSRYDEIAEIRKKALNKFLEKGMPGKHLEKWKYTDLKANNNGFADHIAIETQKIARQTVNNENLPELSAEQSVVNIHLHNACYYGKKGWLTKGIHIETCADILDNPSHPHFSDVIANSSDDPLHELATAFMAYGIVVTIEQDIQQSAIVHLQYHDQDSEENQTFFVNNLIIVKKNADVRIIETRFAKNNQKSNKYYIQQRFRIAEQAKCLRLNLLQIGQNSLHVVQENISIAEKTRYNAYMISSGSGMLRADSQINIDGAQVKADYGIAHLLAEKAHHDVWFQIRHNEGHSDSNAMVRAVLAKKSYAVSQGLIYVAKDAQKTASYEMFSGILLDDASRYMVKPELEIYADDVVCGHGAAIADFNKEAYFYLGARGIEAKKAKKILTKAYIKQVFAELECQIMTGIIDEYIEKNIEELINYENG